MTDFVLFDLDHTISDATWRDSLMPPNADWDEYHRELVNDKPHETCCKLVRMFLKQGCSVLGITARPEKWRSHSMLWLVNNDVPINWILMRRSDDYRKAAELKMELIEKHFSESQRRDILFYFDDLDECCAAVTERFGITSMTVRHRQRK